MGTCVERSGTSAGHMAHEYVRSLTRRIGFLGDMSGGGIPGPIPNPAVKPSSADGTFLVTGWESRSLPRNPFRYPQRAQWHTRHGALFCSLCFRFTGPAVGGGVCRATLAVLESFCNGASPSGKAAAFGAAIRRFESFRPSYNPRSGAYGRLVLPVSLFALARQAGVAPQSWTARCCGLRIRLLIRPGEGTKSVLEA